MHYCLHKQAVYPEIDISQNVCCVFKHRQHGKKWIKVQNFDEYTLFEEDITRLHEILKNIITVTRQKCADLILLKV